ncbi:MAG TPA: septum site-determining protein MinC [Symbiobacteriaceae bacterium]|jgi:septum site-determining protein MinC|nr:septum site-determining protein MinC [Symbiobacteriaceae bacterium]
MRQDIVIRGTTRTGLVILLPEDGDFNLVCQRLRDKLAQGGRFFQGAEVTVQAGRRTFTETEQQALTAILQDHHMSLRAIGEGGDPVAEAQAALRAAEQSRRSGTLPAAALLAESETALVVTKTLRSGQAVRHEGDVIILGDVNPGATVVATGHIVVMGALRGVAHAGCAGNTGALVAATKLRPTQLRIAHVIGRAPDEQENLQPVPEVARVRDGMIVVETPTTENKR